MSGVDLCRGCVSDCDCVRDLAGGHCATLWCLWEILKPSVIASEILSVAMVICGESVSETSSACARAMVILKPP